MFIKRIEIRGFKSFDKKTTIELGRGLDVITGPNGSGKCLPPWELVHLPDGPITSRELFQRLQEGNALTVTDGKGQYVLSEEPTTICTTMGDKIATALVSTGYRKYMSGTIIGITTSDSDDLYLTPDHMLFVFPGLWIRAAILKKGQRISLIKDGSVKWVQVQLINESHFRGDVYDFYVDRLHEYLAGSRPFIVHNSNILDALRFVLGESRTRPLRADKLSALLSDKARDKRVLLRLILDNSDKRIPTAGDEVIFARDMNEQGESNYYVDRKRTSKLIFVNTLALAGLSNRSYNIVMQGEISRLADKDPVEIRQEIESAIGLSQYDERKALAEEELKTADVNVKVAAARLDEVRSRLESLEQERNSVLRSLQIRSELNRIKAAFLSSRIAELRSALKANSVTCEVLEQRAKTAQSEREQLSNVHKQRLDRLFELSQRIAQATSSGDETTRRKLMETEIGINALIEDVKRKTQELREARNNCKGLSRKLLKAKGSSNRLRDRIRLEKARTDGLVGILNKQRTQAQRLFLLRKNQEDEVAHQRRILSTLEERSREMISELAAKEKLTEALRTKIDGSKKRLRELERTSRVAKIRLRGMQRSFQRVSKRVESMQDELEKRLSELDAFTEESNHVSHVIQKGSLKLAEINGRISTLRETGSKTAAISFDDLVKGLGANVLGKLRDLIEYDKRVESAVVAALDEWLDAYVVPDPHEALAISITLRRLGVFSGRILSMTMPKPSERNESVDQRTLLSRIRYPKNLASTLNNLIGSLRYASSVEEIREALAEGLPVVTDEGIFISPLGFSKVVSSKVPEERRALEAILKGYLSEISEQIEEATRLRQRLVEGALTKIKANVSAAEKDYSTAKEVGKEFQYAIQKMNVEIERTENERNRSAEELNRMRKVMIKQEIETSSIRSAITKTQRSLRRGYAQLTLSEDRMARLRKTEESASKSTSSVEKSVSKFTALLKDLMRSLSDSKQKISQLEKTRQTEQVRRRALRDEVKRANAHLKDLRNEKTDLLSVKSEKGPLENYDNLMEEKKSISDEVESLMQDIRKKEQLFVESVQAAKESSILVDKLKTELEALDRELASLGARHEENPPPVDQNVLRDLENELASLGALNMLSVEQYKEQATNYELVSSRLNKLEEERAAIVEFMQSIENQKREEFIRAYEEVNSHFSEYFNKITGGKAWLEIENPQSPFDGGVNMMVQFAEKSPRIASSLSGGEKSVSALCFIFAMQKLRPSPFYILDEVDAHLDLLNLERYANILKDRSSESQIIVISLKDYVASRADRVIGVYNKGGSSRILEMAKIGSKVANV